MKKTRNPLADYTTFTGYNAYTLIDQWVEYIKTGVMEIKKFLENLIKEYNFIRLDYYPTWSKKDTNYSPFFVIKIPTTISVKETSKLWYEICEKIYEYAEKNDIIPSFDKLGFDLDY